MRINMPTKLFNSLGHIESEYLDLYCAGRLPVLDRQCVGTHLEVCSECRDQQRLEESFRAAVLANQDLLPASAIQIERNAGWARSPRTWAPVAAIAASLLMGLAYWPVVHAVAGPPVDVTLLSLRGESPAAARVGSSLRLRLDIGGLPASSRLGDLDVEIVDARGARVASGRAHLDQGQAVFVSGVALPAGQYWVRLWQDGHCLREYSLPLR